MIGRFDHLWDAPDAPGAPAASGRDIADGRVMPDAVLTDDATIPVRVVAGSGSGARQAGAGVGGVAGGSRSAGAAGVAGAAGAAGATMVPTDESDDRAEPDDRDEPGHRGEPPAPTPTLELSTGERVPLDGRVVVGRDPAPEAGVRAVRVDARLVDLSRTHLEVMATDAGVFVRDLGSANGSVLIRDGGRVRLEPNVPVPLGPDDTLVLADSIGARLGRTT